jgi:hypothetical protein
MLLVLFLIHRKEEKSVLTLTLLEIQVITPWSLVYSISQASLCAVSRGSVQIADHLKFSS